MGNRAFHAVVVLLWVSTTGWLVVSKVLPPLLVGEPPTYRSTLPDEEQRICWRLEWNGQPVGWAATQVVPGADAVTEVHSRMVLRQLPIQEMSPLWLRPLLEQIGQIDMDARSRVEINPLGALSRFTSTVRLGEMEQAIRMRGEVENSQLAVEVRTGELHYKKRIDLAPDALVANELSPQAELPGLRLGQTWTMPVYNPFYPNQPMEVLQAAVEEAGLLHWDGAMQRTLIVKYRPDSGAGLLASNKPRGVLWVAADGRVLQQETNVFSSQLRFIRMTSDEARAHCDELGENWLEAPLSRTATRAPATP